MERRLEKRKNREHKVIEKFVRKRDKLKQKYITKRILKRKFKNAQNFTNTDFVNEDGIIKLRDGSYARVFSVDAIDLSLTSNTQKNNFFHQLKYKSYYFIHSIFLTNIDRKQTKNSYH